MEYILITGGAGFIGLNLAVELIEKNQNIIIVDDLKNAYVENVKRLQKHFPNTLFFRHDVRDKEYMEMIFSTYSIKRVVHLAAKKYVDESQKHKNEYYKNNINSLNTILDLSKKYNVSQFVFSSTVVVYGNPNKCPVKENAPLFPLSPYAETKKIGEEIILKWQKENPKTKCLLFRFSNPVGANTKYLFGDNSKKKKMALIPYLINNTLENKSICLNGNTYDTKDGTPIRDYIHIVDLAHIVSKVMLNEKNNNIELYNVGCGNNGYSVLEALHEVEDCLQQKIYYTFGSKRKGDCQKFVCDITHLIEKQHIQPKNNLKEMVNSQIIFMKHIQLKNKK